MPQRNLLFVALFAGSAFILSAAGTANAQNALGGGDALDRNPGVGTGGRNSPRPPDPYASRNAVITGEVLGGREFRGRVGYTSPGDFRGRLRSDDLYRFQADSAWSNPAMFSGTGATYDQLRFGQGLGELTLARDFTGSTPTVVQQMPGPVNYSNIAESRLRYDSEVVSTTSLNRMLTAVQPSTIGTAVNAEGEALAINVSGVRGLSLDAYNERWEQLGLSTYDQMRLREEQRLLPGSIEPDDKTVVTPGDPGSRVGSQVDTRFEDLINANAVPDARVDSTQSTDYARVLQRVADRYSNTGDRQISIDPAILRRLDEQYKTLKGQLKGEQDESSGAPRQSADPTSSAPLPQQPTGSQAPSSSPIPGRPGEATIDRNRNPNDLRDPRNPPTDRPPTPGAGDVNQPKPATDGQAIKPSDLAQLGPALRHDQKITNLTSQEQGRFNELMMSAQDQLKRGEYLQAEQRFQRAVRFAPGDPMALAGMANAQIGAGLHLSAGFTLRSLFTQHPEMIDATYGEGLIPPRAQLETAVTAVRAKIEAGGDRSSNALLLAYLGRQLGDKAMIEEGLKAMTADAADDPLPPVLRMVWLDTGADPAAVPEK